MLTYLLPCTVFGDTVFQIPKIARLATPLAFNPLPPTEGFPWDDLREIFRGCQRMAKVPNGEKISENLTG